MPDAFVFSAFSSLFNTDVAQDLAEPVVYVLHEKSFLGSLVNGVWSDTPEGDPGWERRRGGSLWGVRVPT